MIVLDTDSGNKVTNYVKAVMERRNIELTSLHKCATDLLQPADSFLIKKVKPRGRVGGMNCEWTRWRRMHGLIL